MSLKMEIGLSLIFISLRTLEILQKVSRIYWKPFSDYSDEASWTSGPITNSSSHSVDTTQHIGDKNQIVLVNDR